MSRTIYKQMISAVDALGKVNSILEDKFKKPGINLAQIVEILSWCQDSAIAMGNIIERLHGKGCGSVIELEAYCDQLYPLAMALEDRNEIWRILESLKAHVDRLRVLVDKEVPNRQEIVFFPYKASMWDSLESVYLAARQDPDCDAYVVPVPYYDLNPDRSFGQMHYEGELFPDGIEIMDWRRYPLEERYPDVIYIHNPYDDCNLITSVMPRYFAKNLRKYTECLVYIPYFILEEIDPDNQMAIESMKHFCCLPGVIYAHKVIVQSENMRRIYVNEYIKTMQEAGVIIKPEALENKILGLGSPKLDKVLGTRKEDCIIPEQWLKKIRKEDGSWKKIIFYNTSVGALLNFREKMLDKMRWTFSVFRERQQDVVLLWRPHPLIQATILSMHPDLWNAYKELRDTYLSESWGIYDDTPDVDRAVAVSDAYYGDTSSVIRLYQAIGKPVMIQDVWTVEDCYYAHLDDGVYVDGYIWGLCVARNQLFRLDVETGIVKYITVLGKDHCLFRKISMYDGKLILIPGSGNQLAVYDKETGMVSEYEIDANRKLDSQIYEQFGDAVEYNEFLYLFPIGASYILIINKITMDLDYMEGPVREYQKRFGKTNIIFSETVCNDGKNAFVPCYSENLMLVLDMGTREYHWEEIPLQKEKGIISADYNKGNFYMAARSGQVISWKRGEKVVRLLYDARRDFIRIVYSQGALWLISDDRGPVVSYNIAKNRADILAYDKTFQFNPAVKRTFRQIIKGDFCYYLSPRCANELIKLNIKEKKLEFIKIKPDESMPYFLEKAGIICYEDTVGWNNYYNYVMKNIDSNRTSHLSSICGNMIYSTIKSTF